jgi:RNA polymerase sigma-70 factor (ECF subfamily)
VTSTPDLPVIDPTVMKLVRTKAAGLAGTYGFSASDRDDLRQELLLDCLVRLRKFDPAKSSRRTFVHRVIRHRVATLLDGQRAPCRDYRMCRDSLDAPVQLAACESIPLGETVSTDDYEARIGRNVLSSREPMELRIDIDRGISLLPPELAAVADLLKSVSAVEAGRRLGLSRATVYRRIFDIRGVFAAAGLDDYLRQRQAERQVTAAPGRISSSRKVRARRPHLTPGFLAACPPTAIPKLTAASRGINSDA